MLLYDKIKKCNNDEELKKLKNALCNKYTLKSSLYNNCDVGVIGSVIDYNPCIYDICDIIDNDNCSFKFVNCWNGYIPLGIKIVYGSMYNY